MPTTARFTFGTGKLGDLAGFTSAIVLAMIALLIGYEAISRFIAPVPIHFDEAIPIAALGLVVNVASVLLLSGGEHDHGRSHRMHGTRDHAHDATHGLEAGETRRQRTVRRIATTICALPSFTCWPTRPCRCW